MGNEPPSLAQWRLRWYQDRSLQATRLNGLIQPHPRLALAGKKPSEPNKPLKGVVLPLQNAESKKNKSFWTEPRIMRQHFPLWCAEGLLFWSGPRFFLTCSLPFFLQQLQGRTCVWWEVCQGGLVPSQGYVWKLSKWLGPGAGVRAQNSARELLCLGENAHQLVWARNSSWSSGLLSVSQYKWQRCGPAILGPWRKPRQLGVGTFNSRSVWYCLKEADEKCKM